MLGLGGVAQVECGGHRLGLAGALHPRLGLAMGVGALLQAGGPLSRLREPALQSGHFTHVVEYAIGRGLR